MRAADQRVGDVVSVDKSCVVVDNSDRRDSTVNEHRQNVDQLRVHTHLHPYIITAVICTVLQTPRPTQPSIPPGSVNEYQLRLGRQKAGMVHSVSG